MIVTNIVPTALAVPANHTFVVLGQAASIDSLPEPQWQDAQGNLYSVTSGEWKDKHVQFVTDPNILAMLAGSEQLADFLALGVDPAQVQIAQTSYVYHGDAAELQLQADKITAFASDQPLSDLARLGLVPVEMETEQEEVISDDQL